MIGFLFPPLGSLVLRLSTSSTFVKLKSRISLYTITSTFGSVWSGQTVLLINQLTGSSSSNHIVSKGIPLPSTIFSGDNPVCDLYGEFIFYLS